MPSKEDLKRRADEIIDAKPIILSPLLKRYLVILSRDSERSRPPSWSQNNSDP